MRIRTEGTQRWEPAVIVEASRRAVPRVEPILRAAMKGQASRTASFIHSRSGQLAGSVKGTVRRKPYGYLLRVAPGKGTVNVRTSTARTTHTKYDVFYGRFVEHGTGERGPRGRAIPKGKRGVIPVGAGFREPTGRGQRPQRPFGRARGEYDATVSRSLDERVQKILDEEILRASLRAVR